MLETNQTVYYTSGPFIQEASFLSYDGDCCVLQTTLGELKIRKSRVFTAEEANAQGLLRDNAAKRVSEAFAV